MSPVREEKVNIFVKKKGDNVKMSPAQEARCARRAFASALVWAQRQAYLLSAAPGEEIFLRKREIEQK